MWAQDRILFENTVRGRCNLSSSALMFMKIFLVGNPSWTDMLM